MAHFAKISEEKYPLLKLDQSIIFANKVLYLTVIDNSVLNEPTNQFPETESIGKNFINELSKLDPIFLGEWKQTSYNGNFRKQVGREGDFYYEDADVFISNSPYTTFCLDENFDWVPITDEEILSQHADIKLVEIEKQIYLDSQNTSQEV